MLKAIEVHRWTLWDMEENMNTIHLIIVFVYAPENIVYFEIKWKNKAHRNSKKNKLKIVILSSLS